MKPLKEKITITIDGDILEKLRKEAEYDDRSLSQYINIILKEHIKSQENKCAVCRRTHKFCAQKNKKSTC